MPTRKGHARREAGAFKGAYSFLSPFEDAAGTNPEANVPSIDQAAFVRHADIATVSCPVSQALAGTEITLEARLTAK